MKKVLSLLIALTLVLSLFAGCSSTDEGVDTPDSTADATSETPSTEDDEAPSGEKVQVELWGVNTLTIGSGNEEMIAAFNEMSDTIEIVAESTPNAPGYETQDLTKLTAAIAAGDAPDIAVLNAPFIMEVAARNVLEPLDQYIDAAGFDMSQFYDYTITNMTFEDKIWGLPNGVDTRFLYYNKKLFEEAGLDPEAPPTTWEELLDYAELLTIESDSGDLEQIGFIPNYGNSWLYLYLLQNGGQMVSDDGLTATLNTPEVVEALEFMVEGYDRLGGAEMLNAYVSAYATATGADDPLLTGEVAMVINGNWAIETYARYGADMMDDIGYAYAPTPTGDDFVTWSGGWSYGMPKGAENTSEAFEVMAWLSTDGGIYRAEGISAYNQTEGLLDVPVYTASRPINDQLNDIYLTKMENPYIVEMITFGIDLLEESYALPAHPVGQYIWAEHARAIDNAIYRTDGMTAQDALDEANSNVQTEIDNFYANYTPVA